MKCSNYEFCESNRVNGVESEYCMDCGTWFKFGNGWNKLDIINTTEECAVCMNSYKKKVMFPTKCGHSFCIRCSRDILLWNENRYRLSPVQYGCPPCPNGCKNPEKGPQCDCEEYSTIQEKWILSKPSDYKRWSSDEGFSISNGEKDNSYGSLTCPLCRKKYIRIK
jgi:hypothetical protein